MVVLWPWNVSGQVINDNIENRLELQTDGSPLTSNTSHCTVQWECVDQSLTGKCVQYHNDQWFYFNSGTRRNLYLNIYNQDCRDVRGIQLIVLQGTPCEPSTYKIEACISLANQDNIFLPLDSLNTNEEYLINVDGYLHDFCVFQIEISETPKGLPAQFSKNRVNFDLSKNENLVHISWQTSEEDNYQHYEIHRWKSIIKRSKLITTIQHEKNAYGVSTLDYSYIDTLVEKGLYYYKIVGISLDSIGYLLAEKQINITNENLVQHKDEALLTRKIEVTLDFEDETPLTVLLLNRDSQRILLRQDFTFNQDSNMVFFFIDPFIKKGITRFEIRVIDLLTNSRKSYFFGNE